jgi:ribokinase
MIAIAGGYGVGMTMTVPRAPLAGETVSGGVLASGHGGKGSNQAVAVRRLGHDARLFTAIGDDAAGREAFGFWEREGVDARAVVTVPAATMTGFILVEPDGENRIAIADGALSRIGVRDVAAFEPAIHAAALVVVSLELPIAVAAEVLRIARAAGVRTLLNPAPASDAARDLLGLADVVTPNRRELELLAEGSPGDALDPLIDRLRVRGAHDVVVTLGGEGVVVDDGAGRLRLPAVTAGRVVDTTGAGDAFTAALAVALAEGRGLASAAAFAAAAGALAVTVPEVLPSLPRRPEVDRLEIARSTA